MFPLVGCKIILWYQFMEGLKKWIHPIILNSSHAIKKARVKNEYLAKSGQKNPSTWKNFQKYLRVDHWYHYTWDESIFNFFKATPYTYVICYIILVVCVSMCMFVRLYNITLSTVSLNLIWEKNVSKVSGIPELTPLIDLNRSKNWISGGVASKNIFWSHYHFPGEK